MGNRELGIGNWESGIGNWELGIGKKVLLLTSSPPHPFTPSLPHPLTSPAPPLLTPSLSTLRPEHQSRFVSTREVFVFG
jgi:hypothetical protein